MKAKLRLSRWCRRLAESAPRYRPWLLDRGSLTRRLQVRCREFSVQDVRQTRALALCDEHALVGAREGERVLVREVYLCCAAVPVVFAHSVLARRTLRGAWQRLARLGARPLGEALFADPQVRRTALHFRKLGRRDPLYRRACRLLAEKPPTLWARRSAFGVGGHTILVTEVFLPGILGLAP